MYIQLMLPCENHLSYLLLDCPKQRRINIMNIFTPKIQTVGSIKDFLTASPVKVTTEAMTVGALTGALITLISRTDTVLAGPMADKMVKAMDPLIDLIQGLSYPVGFIMITAGFLVVMTGNKQK